MRKEITGILLFFLVVLTLVSLLSYSPTDPSIHNARTAEQIHNLFGLMGAHLSGILVGLFGLGAFWIPILLLLLSIQFFGNQPVKNLFVIVSVAGGILLVITTGGLFAIRDPHYLLFGSKFSSGGIIGIPLKTVLLKYANSLGGTLILVVLFLIGFIMATGVSMISFFRISGRGFGNFLSKVKAWMVIRAERKKKARENKPSRKAAKAAKRKFAEDIEIKPLPRNPVKPAPKPKQRVFEFMEEGEYQFPSINFLDDPQTPCITADNENLRMQSKLLEKKLEDFGVKGKVVTISPGPVITTFEY